MIICTKSYEAGTARRNPTYAVKDSRTGDTLHAVHFRKSAARLKADYLKDGREVHVIMRDKLGRISYPNV